MVDTRLFRLPAKFLGGLDFGRKVRIKGTPTNIISPDLEGGGKERERLTQLCSPLNRNNSLFYLWFLGVLWTEDPQSLTEGLLWRIILVTEDVGSVISGKVCVCVCVWVWGCVQTTVKPLNYLPFIPNNRTKWHKTFHLYGWSVCVWRGGGVSECVEGRRGEWVCGGEEGWVSVWRGGGVSVCVEGRRGECVRVWIDMHMYKVKSSICCSSFWISVRWHQALLQF